MKKTLLALMATASIFLASCGSKSDSGQVAVADEALTVDNVLDNAEKYVGDTIVVEGECSHLCKHGGRKAFLVSAKDDRMLRAEAAGAFGAFEKDAIHKVLRVKGVLVEDRIDEAAVKKMEADYAKLEEVHGENVEVGCESEKAAQGQSEINTFAARMKDYRNKIAERLAKEGKAYLSFYHIDAESYEIVKSEKK